MLRTVNLVIALPSEAKPIVDRHRLRRQRQGPGFRVYSNSHVRLVVTGVGRVQAAAGTAYLAGLEPDAERVWLNIGLAGHGSLPVGAGLVARRITDGADGRNWYPPVLEDMPGRAVHLTTYDQPVCSYPPNVACDMEAAAFYAVATRCSPGASVQCYKVVSDNDARSMSMVTPRLAEALIGDQLQPIADALQALREPGCGELHIT